MSSRQPRLTAVNQFYLVAPHQIVMKTTHIERIPHNSRQLEVVCAAICGSDLQYYKGEKSPEKMKERLPLILLHEGVCRDSMTRVRYIPIAGDDRNIPEHLKHNTNIWPQLPYLGSTQPGLAQTHIVYPKKLLIPVPDTIPDQIACLTEPLSIALCAVRTMNTRKTDHIAIIGTGGISYLLCLVLRSVLKLSKEQLTVFGVDDEKCTLFSQLANLHNYNKTPLPQTKHFTQLFEIVGRSHMSQTVSTAFQLIQPGGTIGILGISDLPCAIPVHQLVNHQITLRGLTRSTRKDYHDALKLLETPHIIKQISTTLIGKTWSVSSGQDMRLALDHADSTRALGRTLVTFAKPQ